MKIQTAIRKARFHFVITHGVYVRVTRKEAQRLVTDAKNPFFWKFSIYREEGSFFFDFSESNAHSDYKLHQCTEQLPLDV